ncbi:hypothetical protein L208DRAFT_190763 [Tricholoma matsutake]|nr:hypothetical protein L208DRAFT_190763 [Tricholoma matsutake 945]
MILAASAKSVAMVAISTRSPDIFFLSRFNSRYFNSGFWGFTLQKRFSPNPTSRDIGTVCENHSRLILLSRDVLSFPALIANRIIPTDFDRSSSISFLPRALFASLDTSRPILITVRWRDHTFGCLNDIRDGVHPPSTEEFTMTTVSPHGLDPRGSGSGGSPSVS